MSGLFYNNTSLEKIESNSLDKKMYLPSCGKLVTQRELNAKINASKEVHQLKHVVLPILTTDQINNIMSMILSNSGSTLWWPTVPKSSFAKFLDLEEAQKDLEDLKDLSKWN